MEKTEKVENGNVNLLLAHFDEILPAMRRAVRDALLRHKKLGNSIAIGREGKVIILQPEEIEVELHDPR